VEPLIGINFIRERARPKDTQQDPKRLYQRQGLVIVSVVVSHGRRGML